MASNGNGKTSAELEREVDQQRIRLETRVNEIQERLSPGQLVDEFLNYTKSSGGSEFFANLGRSVQNNPLPIALTGIGLAWLMARANAPAPASSTEFADRDWDRRLADNGLYDNDRGEALGEPYPYAQITGTSLRRVGQATDEAGKRYSEFADETGRKFKAMSDDLGNRAGHFTDEAGARYRGFKDAAGNRIATFLDEAGARLQDAQGWASDTWRGGTDQLAGMRDAVAGGAADLRRRAGRAGADLQGGANAVGRSVSDLLQQQPLIGGALAFAVGAAVASALPPTRQEDELVGKTSDQLKAEGMKLAGGAYEQGKEQIAEAYEGVRDKASEAYSKARDGLTASDTTLGNA